MIRYRPGFAPVATDGEKVPAPPRNPEQNPLPSVAEAMALAAQRQTQVLTYTREPPKESPLKQNLREDGPTMEQWVKAGYRPDDYPPVGYAELPSDMLTLYKAMKGGPPPSLGAGVDALVVVPHSVNDKPEV